MTWRCSTSRRNLATAERIRCSTRAGNLNGKPAPRRRIPLPRRMRISRVQIPIRSDPWTKEIPGRVRPPFRDFVSVRFREGLSQTESQEGGVGYLRAPGAAEGGRLRLAPIPVAPPPAPNYPGTAFERMSLILPSECIFRKRFRGQGTVRSSLPRIPRHLRGEVHRSDRRSTAGPDRFWRCVGPPGTQHLEPAPISHPDERN